MSVSLKRIREEEDQEICNSQRSGYGSDILFTVVLKNFILSYPYSHARTTTKVARSWEIVKNTLD